MVINWNETGELTLLEEDKKILYKITLDSITPSRRRAMVELSKYSILETSGLATKLDMPTSSINRSLEDLTALGIARREKGSGNKNRWYIISRYRNLILKFEGIENTGLELTEGNAETNESLLEEAEALIKEQELQTEGMF